VIAHRLNTIVHADRILVVEDGIVVESGRHDQLLRQGGRYALLYRMLFRDQAAAHGGVLSFPRCAGGPRPGYGRSRCDSTSRQRLNSGSI
jgi:hypothetical protein